MTIVEALTDPRVLAGDMWARPKGWRYSAIGIVFGTQRYGCFPTLRSDSVRWTPRANDLTCDWEVVSPDDVNAEFNERYR